MPNGFGKGRGFFRGGIGFGFRGSSPPWPYIGQGRGGLPRCRYFLGGAGWAPGAWSYPATPGFDVGQSPYPYNAASPIPGYAPPAPQMTPEQELDFLKNQDEAVKGQLGQIEARMRDMESEE